MTKLLILLKRDKRNKMIVSRMIAKLAENIGLLHVLIMLPFLKTIVG